MSSLKALVDTPMPVNLAGLSVGPDGALRARMADPVKFSFRFFGIVFDAHVTRLAGHPMLTVDAKLGLLPFSIEGTSQRREALTVIAYSHNGLPGGGLSVEHGRTVKLHARLPLLEPIKPLSLIAAATDLVIAAQPWLGLLARCGVTPTRH